MQGGKIYAFISLRSSWWGGDTLSIFLNGHLSSLGTNLDWATTGFIAPDGYEITEIDIQSFTKNGQTYWRLETSEGIIANNIGVNKYSGLHVTNFQLAKDANATYSLIYSMKVTMTKLS